MPAMVPVHVYAWYFANSLAQPAPSHRTFEFTHWLMCYSGAHCGSVQVLDALPAEPDAVAAIAGQIAALAIERASSEHHRETESLKAALSERETQASELQTRCDELLSDHVTLTEDLASAHESIARLEGEKAALAASVRTLAERIQKLEAFKRTLIASLQDDTPGSAAAGISAGGGGSSLWAEAPKAAPPPEGERLVQEILANAKPAALPQSRQLMHNDSGEQLLHSVLLGSFWAGNSLDVYVLRHMMCAIACNLQHCAIASGILSCVCCSDAASSFCPRFANMTPRCACAASKQHRIQYKNGTSQNGYSGSANGLRPQSASGRERGISPASSLANPHPLNNAHIMHEKPPASQLPAAQLHNAQKGDMGGHQVSNENSMASVNAGDHSGPLPALGGSETPVPGDGDAHPQRVDGKEFFRQVRYLFFFARMTFPVHTGCTLHSS